MLFTELIKRLSGGDKRVLPDNANRILNVYLQTDWQRFLFCQAMASYYAARHRQGLEESRERHSFIPDYRWYSSLVAKDLQASEEQWQRRAAMYSQAVSIHGASERGTASLPKPRTQMPQL